MKVNRFRFHALLLFIGGLVWVIVGTRLALSPPGNPALDIYRDSKGSMPLLSIGMLFITSGMVIFYRELFLHKGLAKFAFILIQSGSVLYFIGHSLRQFLNGAWEPAAPVGFIMLIIGMFLFGLRSIKVKSLPVPISYSILISSLCLLFFNDQFFTAWMSVPFGLIWIAIGGALFFKPL
ncbi:hypothetical protein [Neobacillus citreus]|uniref:Uncharacterized protein n=1 Tax=Neobacillus citreus TaxID=2833578 RepID=A0A942YFM2_9BACI|nr:hypothetical protein [Neobacillus citreus]MCH6266108.1 hypothetical protein [Neobacillus citreus]